MLVNKRHRESTSERLKECARGEVQVRDEKACKSQGGTAREQSKRE